MNFNAALAQMRNGKQMRHASWPSGFFIWFEEDLANKDGRGNLLQMNSRGQSQVWFAPPSDLTIDSWEEFKK